MSIRPLILVVSLLVMAACSDNSATGNANAPACTGAVNVTVSAGTTPSFSWSPVCKLFFLNVEATGGADQWGIITDGTNGIAPPVTYGVVPAGAQLNTVGTAALASGTTYSVGVFRWTGPNAQDGVIIGSKSFTP